MSPFNNKLIVANASACGVRGPRFKSLVFIAVATAICSLRHGLRLTAVPTSTQPLFGVAKLSTSFGWGKRGNVTSAGWHVTLCNATWHVSSRSGQAGLLTKGKPLYRVYLLYFYLHRTRHVDQFSRLCSHSEPGDASPKHPFPNSSRTLV